MIILLNDYLLNVESINSVFLKADDKEFDEIIVTFTAQSGRSL